MDDAINIQEQWYEYNMHSNLGNNGPCIAFTNGALCYMGFVKVYRHLKLPVQVL